MLHVCPLAHAMKDVFLWVIVIQKMDPIFLAVFVLARYS